MVSLENGYVVQEILGEGSFSRVFKLQHKSSGQQFAGKYLKHPFSRRKDLINCTEISIMKRVEDHPNILKLTDLICNSFPCHIVLVFELMDMNLYEFIRERRSPLSESISRIYIFQIISGIQYLHKNGVFHRDVKPENVLLKFPKHSNNISNECSRVVVKLADFGSAKSVETEYPLTEYVATRWYRAPECIITAGYYGPKIDIWSAGCIFYELLTLKPLFPGQSELDQLNKIHLIMGSPNESTQRRFRHIKGIFEFPKMKCVKLSTLLPNLSKLGMVVLKACLSYLPDTRIDSTRLLEHSYFVDVRTNRHTPPGSAKKQETDRKIARRSSTSSIAAESPKTTFKEGESLCIPGPTQFKQKRREESGKLNNVKPKRQRKHN